MRLFPKLALTVSGMLSLSLAGASGSFYWIEQKHLHAEVRQEQQAVLQNLVHMAQESYLSNDDLMLVKYTGWLRSWTPALARASVIDTTGRVLSHSEPSFIGQWNPVGAAGAAQELVLSDDIRIGTNALGTASVAFSRDLLRKETNQRLAACRARLETVGLFSLGLGILTSFGFALSWTRPIAQLGEWTQAMGQGRLSSPPPALVTRADEVGTLARSLQTMTDQLRELDQMKEDFVSAVTHELRSPLGAMESYLDLMREEAQQGIDPSSWEPYLDRLRVNVQRLTRFVNDLLDVAALERGKLSLAPKRISLSPLLDDVLDFLAPQLKARGLASHCWADPSLPWIYVDPDKIRQILINLFSNAMKFTPAGGLIELRAARQADFVEVVVKDSGCGISEADQKKLFSKFQQGRTSRPCVKGPKGTGLGLALSRCLAELHGGTLTVQSKLGKGSAFILRLPITPTSLSPRLEVPEACI